LEAWNAAEDYSMSRVFIPKPLHTFGRHALSNEPGILSEAMSASTRPDPHDIVRPSGHGPGGEACYNGMLSCFFQGFFKSLLRSIRSARATRRRVE
jgi:hypothetical protein